MTAIICLFCAFVLSACNSDKSEISISDRQYNLYIADYAYSQEDGTMFVYVALKGEEKDLLNTKLDWHSEKYPQDVWYNREDVVMTADPSAICDEVNDAVTEEQREYDGVKYNVLKVVLRYDTIYKSIKSDVGAVKRGNRYEHCFELDGGSAVQSFGLTRRTQNSANWYSILIACGIIFAAAVTLVALSIKGGLWQKKKKKSE